MADSATTVVVVATATSAEPAVALPSDLRSQLRASAVKGRQTCISIVTPEGELHAVDLTPRRANGQVENGPARTRRVDERLTAVADELAGLARSGPGLDPLTMIDDAVRRHPTPGTLIVITSGVSTVAPVDLRVLGWGLDAKQQADRLQRDQQLPDLTGWRVRFVGLGDVAGRQPILPLPLRMRIRALWTAICESAQAVTCVAATELIAGADPVSRNAVPVVPLPIPVAGAEQITLPDALLFAIGSSDLQPGADHSLSQVVGQAVRTGRPVRVTGHTDAITGTPAGNRALSARRARAVATRLLQLGLPRAQLGPVTGVGQDGASPERERSDPARVGLDRNVDISFLERKIK